MLVLFVNNWNSARQLAGGESDAAVRDGDMPCEKRTAPCRAVRIMSYGRETSFARVPGTLRLSWQLRCSFGFLFRVTTVTCHRPPRSYRSVVPSTGSHGEGNDGRL